METCSQCHSDISEEAKVCPTCGHPQFMFGIVASIIAMIIVFIVGMKFMPRFEHFTLVVGFMSGATYHFVKNIRN